MNDEHLANLLRELDAPPADNGFTESVMAKLPVSNLSRWRIPLLAGAYLLGCTLVLALFPVGQLASLAHHLATAPELVVAVVGSLSPLSWLFAKKLVNGQV